MPDFVKPNCELTTGEIAALTRAKLRDGDPSDRRIGNIAPLDTATASDFSFLDNSRYRGELGRHARRRLPDRAAVCGRRSARPCRAGNAASLSRLCRGRARAVFRHAAAVVAVRRRAAAPRPRMCIHSARIEASVTIDPLAVIGPRAEIGADTRDRRWRGDRPGRPYRARLRDRRGSNDHCTR